MSQNKKCSECGHRNCRCKNSKYKDSRHRKSKHKKVEIVFKIKLIPQEECNEKGKGGTGMTGAAGAIGLEPFHPDFKLKKVDLGDNKHMIDLRSGNLFKNE